MNNDTCQECGAKNVLEGRPHGQMMTPPVFKCGSRQHPDTGEFLQSPACSRIVTLEKQLVKASEHVEYWAKLYDKVMSKLEDKSKQIIKIEALSDNRYDALRESDKTVEALETMRREVIKYLTRYDQNDNRKDAQRIKESVLYILKMEDDND